MLNNLFNKFSVVLATAFVATSLLTGCATNATPKTEKIEATSGKSELTVFAAASLSDTLTEISTKYMLENINVDITFNFDSSGTLKTQITEGANCDIFISAAQKQMDQLEIVDETTRVNILENKVVLAVAKDNPTGVSSFYEIADKCNLIALGNDDVPVGQYSVEILENIGVLKQLQDDQKITYGSNVKEVTTQILQGSVDCGIIYKTDAFSSSLTVVDEADEVLCRRVIYPAAVLKNSKNTAEAKKFLNYMQNEKSMQVFSKVGFEQVK